LTGTALTVGVGVRVGVGVVVSALQAGIIDASVTNARDIARDRLYFLLMAEFLSATGDRPDND